MRTAGSALLVTVNEMVASPCPVAESPSWIHPLAAVAVHGQSRFVATLRVPAPPAARNDVGVAVTLTPHFDVEGDVTVVVDELHAAAAAAVIDNDNSNMNRDIDFGVSPLRQR